MDLLDLAKPSLDNMSDEQKLMASLRLHSLQHILYPPFFSRASDLPTLNWHKIKFLPENRTLLPDEKGVYAFALEFDMNGLPPIIHILYVGKAGDISSNNTIYKRYYDYIRTQRINDRASIHQMLNLWKDNLSYYYATVDEDVSTGDIEKTLLDIFIPPYNRGDYSVQLRSLLRGANIL